MVLRKTVGSRGEIRPVTGGPRQTQQKNAVVLLGARWHRDLRVLAPIYSCPVGAVLAVSDVHAYLACDCGPKIETKAQAFGSVVAGSRDLFSGPFFMQVVP